MWTALNCRSSNYNQHKVRCVCYRVSLHGSSFMVYQIRHMVAMATLVALGRVPLLFVEAIMCPNARALLPLGPPGVSIYDFASLLIGTTMQPPTECCFLFPRAHEDCNGVYHQTDQAWDVPSKSLVG